MSDTKDQVKQILIAYFGGGGHATVAADMLHKAFIIMARKDLPGTSPDGSGNIAVDGVEHSVWPITRACARRARLDALEYLAAAEAIEATLPSRSDEIAAAFTSKQQLIDRIIELEAKVGDD